jgi:hypothetical protein
MLEANSWLLLQRIQTDRLEQHQLMWEWLDIQTHGGTAALPDGQRPVVMGTVLKQAATPFSEELLHPTMSRADLENRRAKVRAAVAATIGEQGQAYTPNAQPVPRRVTGVMMKVRTMSS